MGSAEAKPLHTPLLILISAPSGAGKTTLCQNLIRADSGVHRVITCTTRSPRADEIQGKDYHFMSPQAFDKAFICGHFIEHAIVYGNQYGTRKQDIFHLLNKGHDVILNIDVQGAASIRQYASEDPYFAKHLITVFLAPPSLIELKKRLCGRAMNSNEDTVKRLKNAEREIAAWKHFDYLITSGSPEEDLGNIRSIVDAERLRTARSVAPFSSSPRTTNLDGKTLMQPAP
ncbi:MAG: guanylate kinase [Verrucomicrobiota bacterium]|jgi:guanylate kinase|nr:guanylate kinase [Verrucomicrobiota bacterium]